jgi:hypothetical protein
VDSKKLAILVVLVSWLLIGLVYALYFLPIARGGCPVHCDVKTTSWVTVAETVTKTYCVILKTTTTKTTTWVTTTLSEPCED